MISVPRTGIKLFVNLLQGSKLVASKCKVHTTKKHVFKVFRYYLIINEQPDPCAAVVMAQAVAANVRKSIVSGKQGEAGLKYFADGTFICAADTISDNLKVVETAIEQAGLKEKVGIGLVWMAELFYNLEQKKYELENPKQLLDVDQLIEFYVKLCTERPSTKVM